VHSVRVGRYIQSKVKLFLYRIGGPLGPQEVEVPTISRQSAHEGGKVVSPTHRPPLPQKIFLVLISVRSWLDPQGHSLVRRVKSMKNSNGPIGNRTCDLRACRTVHPRKSTSGGLKICSRCIPLQIYIFNCLYIAIPVAAQSKAFVCGLSLAGVACSNPTRGMDVCLLWVFLFQAEISATGRSLVQRSPTDCGVCLSVIKWKQTTSTPTVSR
jgi:hypothetical protein